MFTARKFTANFEWINLKIEMRDTSYLKTWLTVFVVKATNV